MLLRWANEKGLVDIAMHAGPEGQQASTDKSVGNSSSDNMSEIEMKKLAVADLRSKYSGDGGMSIAGVNHIAMVSSDMERTCAFYGGVLGLRLSKTIELPGGAGQHFFFDIGSTSHSAIIDGAGTTTSSPSSLAFFYFKDAPAGQPGVSAPDVKQMLSQGQHPSANGSLNHIAFNVQDETVLRQYRKRIQAAGRGTPLPPPSASSSASPAVGGAPAQDRGTPSPYSPSAAALPSSMLGVSLPPSLPLVGFVSPVFFHADNDTGFTADRNDPLISFVSFYFFGPDGEMLEFTSQPLPSATDRDDSIKGVGHLPNRAPWRL